MRAELKPLWAAAVGAGALVSGLAMPAAASAYSTPQCQGTVAAGVGSSLQKVAQLGQNGLGTVDGWAHTFATTSNSVCPTGGGTSFDGQPTYNPAGSGAGNANMCSGGTAFGTGGTIYDWSAVDDPMTPSQLSAANNCAAAVAKPLALHTIPVAQAAIGIAVHLPSGCTINSADFASTGDRFSMLNANLEKALLNDGSVTWSQLLPNSPSCSGPVTRVVRYDTSGTTFQTMEYTAQLNSTDKATWDAAAAGANQDNWPNPGSNIVYAGNVLNPTTCPLSGSPGKPPATSPSSTCNGAGTVAQAVINVPGSIGYVDMSTLRAKGFNYSPGQAYFYVPVQHNGTGTKGATFADPQVNSTGYLAPASTHSSGGASCASSAYTPPSGSDPTLASWDGTIGSNPNQANYPICTLTYVEEWDNAASAYGLSAAEDARQRTVKDYFTYITNSDGQGVLRGLDYDTLTPSLLTIAQNGVAALSNS